MRSISCFAVVGLCAWVCACSGSETSEPGPSAGSSGAPSGTAGASSAGSAGTSRSEKACGARAGSACSTVEYCAYVEGELCGAADAEATCKPRPSGCAEIFMQVCGCDGETYENPCEAAAQGAGVKSSGACAR